MRCEWIHENPFVKIYQMMASVLCIHVMVLGSMSKLTFRQIANDEIFTNATSSTRPPPQNQIHYPHLLFCRSDTERKLITHTQFRVPSQETHTIRGTYWIDGMNARNHKTLSRYFSLIPFSLLPVHVFLSFQQDVTDYGKRRAHWIHEPHRKLVYQ